jgi:uncharacterized protein (TIGR02246 family)
MKYLLGIVVLLLCISCNTAKPTTSVASSAIRAAMEQSAKDWNAGSLDRYMNLYDEESTFMFSSGPVSGLKGIRDNYQKVFFNGDQPKQQLRYEDIVIRPLGKDHALLTGKFVLSGGGLKDRSGIYTLVFVRRATGWKVLHDHSS